MQCIPQDNMPRNEDCVYAVWRTGAQSQATARSWLQGPRGTTRIIRHGIPLVANHIPGMYMRIPAFPYSTMSHTQTLRPLPLLLFQLLFSTRPHPLAFGMQLSWSRTWHSQTAASPYLHRILKRRTRTKR
jgi:hypothetical protein